VRRAESRHACPAGTAHLWLSALCFPLCCQRSALHRSPTRARATKRARRRRRQYCVFLGIGANTVDRPSRPACFSSSDSRSAKPSQAIDSRCCTSRALTQKSGSGSLFGRSWVAPRNAGACRKMCLTHWHSPPVPSENCPSVVGPSSRSGMIARPILAHQTKSRASRVGALSCIELCAPVAGIQHTSPGPTRRAGQAGKRSTRCEAFTWFASNEATQIPLGVVWEMQV
jgi:hypothetical protein